MNKKNPDQKGRKKLTICTWHDTMHRTMKWVQLQDMKLMQTILQSYCQDNMVPAQQWKYRSMEQDGTPRDQATSEVT